MLLMTISVHHNDDGTLQLTLRDDQDEVYARVTGKPLAQFHTAEPFQQLWTYAWDLYDEHVGFRAEHYVEAVLEPDDE